MLKLSGLMVATLAGLFAVMAIYGGEDLRAERRTAPAMPSVSAASDAGGPALAGTTPPPTEAPPPEAEPEMPAPEQTPEQLPRFPGPAIQTSPEFAGREEAPANAETQAAGPALWVTASRLNMRAAPNGGAAVVTGLDGGTRLEPLAPEQGGWVNVRAPGGQTGYVSAQFVSDQPQ